MVEADTLPGGCALYVRWKEARDTAGLNPWPHDTSILKQDAGEYVVFIRISSRFRSFRYPMSYGGPWANSRSSPPSNSCAYVSRSIAHQHRPGQDEPEFDPCADSCS